MEIFIDKNDDLKSAKGGVYALGNFDGVHLGHKEIISNVIEISRSKKIPSGVLIFDPHPRNYFNPKLDDFILSDIKTRSYLLEKTKLDYLGILKFDEAMSNLSPREFIEKVIKDRVGVSHLIVGYNFRFGKNREGNVNKLIKFEKKFNYKTVVTKIFKKKNKVVSSTKIRNMIKLGKVDRASSFLGKFWCIRSIVIKGFKRGRLIGFPTCNMKIYNYTIPKLGVYSVKVENRSFSKNGIANVGYRPTFNGKNILLEVNIFGINKNLYKKELSIHFKKFLRNEKKFKNIDELKKQIKIDITKAKFI